MNTHKYTYMYINKYMCIPHIHIFTYSHTCTHIDALKDKLIHVRTHIHIHPCTYAHTCTQTHNKYVYVGVEGVCTYPNIVYTQPYSHTDAHV